MNFRWVFNANRMSSNASNNGFPRGRGIFPLDPTLSPRGRGIIYIGMDIELKYIELSNL